MAARMAFLQELRGVGGITEFYGFDNNARSKAKAAVNTCKLFE